MVSTGRRHGGGAAEVGMERLKPLHNFDLPCLKWGNQKLLRCMKVESSGDVSVDDRNHSSESGGGAIAKPRRNSEFEKRVIGFRSCDGDRNTGSFYKFPARVGVTGDGEIEATREKLMWDFQTEVVKMKDAIFRERLPGPVTATVTVSASNPPAERPWNLRTGRAACKAPRSPANAVNVSGEVLKPNSSPARNECKYPNGVVNETRPKFSVSISRRELEEDFMAMAGRRLPRKPKKRPRIVQKQLDTLLPGLWLSEISADLYKVPDETETTGKR